MSTRKSMADGYAGFAFGRCVHATHANVNCLSSRPSKQLRATCPLHVGPHAPSPLLRGFSVAHARSRNPAHCSLSLKRHFWTTAPWHLILSLRRLVPLAFIWMPSHGDIMRSEKRACTSRPTWFSHGSQSLFFEAHANTIRLLLYSLTYMWIANQGHILHLFL